MLTGICGLVSCANTGRISGGSKDINPPVLDTLLSSPDKQTNFNPRQLVFFFNEFVEVRDPAKQILVSPPLTYIPSVKSRGKKVVFTLDEKEVLRDNATYTINFGEAIVDFHEGNKLHNFNYVFSTGDYLDSLSISGKIYNAKTGDPEQNMIVVLYDISEDSIVSREKPFYFTKPDRNGNYIFKNIKSDTFKLFALKDENLNYRYDLETEMIAFHNEPIILTGRSIDSVLLRSSLPVPALKLKTKNIKNYGKATLKYNTDIKGDLPIAIQPKEILHYTEVLGDSLGIYYETPLDSFFIFAGRDTVKVLPKGKKEWMSKSRLKAVSPVHKKKIHPSDSVTIVFNYPVESLDFNQFHVSDTIGLLENVLFRSDDLHKTVIISYPWELGQMYTIELDSGTISSMYGHLNEKVKVEFSALSLGNSGSLLIHIDELDSTKTYAVHIHKDKQPLYGYTFKQVADANIELDLLEPMKYNIEIIQDDNENGVWDPGDYYNHRQPEWTFLYKGDILKINRENKVHISWKKSLEFLLESRDAGNDKISNPFENRK